MKTVNNKNFSLRHFHNAKIAKEGVRLNVCMPQRSLNGPHASASSVQASGEYPASRIQTRPTLAATNLGAFSKAAFDDAWIAAIEDSGRQDWYEPLSRRKMAKQ